MVLPCNTYRYERLKDPDEVRVLIIKPGKGNDPIKCRLLPSSLAHDIPKYEALSYTWGSEPAVHQVDVEGRSIYTGSNLHKALRALRQCNSTSFLWVDSLCIDQSNDDERNNQVRRIHEIYQNASNVIACLGDAESDSDIGMEFVPNLLGPDFSVMIIGQAHIAGAFMLLLVS